MDCDFSHPPQDVLRGLEMLKAHEVMLGSRYPDGRSGAVFVVAAEQKQTSGCPSRLLHPNLQGTLIEWDLAFVSTLLMPTQSPGARF